MEGLRVIHEVLRLRGKTKCGIRQTSRICQQAHIIHEGRCSPHLVLTLSRLLLVEPFSRFALLLFGHLTPET